MNAVIFTGQGAQYPGMGKDFYDSFLKAKEVFSCIDKAVGFSVSDKCFYGTKEELEDTSVQQLTILATSLAIFEVFRERITKVDYFSGLSLGEYSCLYPAGVLSLEDLARLVKERSLAMQEAAKSNPSCMFAVLGASEKVLNDNQSLGYYVANINSPKQIVVSLSKEKKNFVREELEKMGFKVIELAVSGGFHSPFMEPARIRLKKVIEELDFSNASVPIVSNFTGRSHTDKEEIKLNLINQLTHPVLWKDCVNYMVSLKVDTFFEMGPSRILKGILRKIDPSIKVVNIEKKEDLERF